MSVFWHKYWWYLLIIFVSTIHHLSVVFTFVSNFFFFLFHVFRAFRHGCVYYFVACGVQLLKRPVMSSYKVIECMSKYGRYLHVRHLVVMQRAVYQPSIYNCRLNKYRYTVVGAWIKGWCHCGIRGVSDSQ